MRRLFLIFFIVFYFGFSSVYPVAANSVSDEAALAEADSDFTFRGQPIHPGLVKEFQNWLSDYRPPITVTVDVGAAYDTNEYADAVVSRKDGSVSIAPGDGGEQFSYTRLGRLDSGAHVLLARDKSPGTGIFQSLTFVRFHLGQGFDRDGIKPLQRLLMSVVRIYAIVGSKAPDIQIKGNDVQVTSGDHVIDLKFEE